MRNFTPVPVPNVMPDGAAETLVHWGRLRNAPARSKESISYKPRPRIFVYMRYSTDLQDEFSFSRQMNAAKEYAARIGGDIIRTYGDPGESGYFSVNRPDFQRLLSDAEKGECDIVLIENADRLSRRVSITTSTYARLADCRVELHSTGEGKWSLLHAALWGAMSEEQRNRIAEFMRSGQVKLLTRRLWPGMAPYGYEKTGVPGELRIVEEEAEIVRRIFKLRRAGVTPDTIADVLHDEGKKPPGKSRWIGSAVRYICQNPIYVGLCVYFKTRQRKREVDGAIVHITEHLGSDKWMWYENSELAILKDNEGREDWSEVQRITIENRCDAGPHRHYLLSRLIFCGSCGAPVAINGGHKKHTMLRCVGGIKRKGSRPKYKPCLQPSIRLELLEDAVISLACQKLDRPLALQHMKSGYERKVEQQFAELNKRRRKLEHERTSKIEQLDATHDAAMVLGTTTRQLAERRTRLCDRIEALDQELASIPVMSTSNTFSLAPAESGPYLDQLMAGRDYRRCDEPLAKLVANFRRLVGRVVVGTEVSTEKINIRIEGPIADVDGKASVEIARPSRNGVAVREAYRMARKGKFEVSETDWDKIRSQLPCEPIWLDGVDEPLDFKKVLEATIFMKRNKIGLQNLPPKLFGPRKHVWAAARMLSYAGVLDVAQEAMVRAKIGLIDGVTLSLEAHRSRKSDPIGRYREWNSRRRVRTLARLEAPERPMHTASPA